MNYSELLQLAKGWGNFKFYRVIIWRLRLNEGSLKNISEKLEVINFQLAKRIEMRVPKIRCLLIIVCAIIIIVFIALAGINSEYLTWNFNDPELAIVGTLLHGFEFLFVRLAPFVFISSVVGIIFTYRKR